MEHPRAASVLRSWVVTGPDTLGVTQSGPTRHIDHPRLDFLILIRTNEVKEVGDTLHRFLCTPISISAVVLDDMDYAGTIKMWKKDPGS